MTGENAGKKKPTRLMPGGCRKSCGATHTPASVYNNKAPWSAFAYWR